LASGGSVLLLGLAWLHVRTGGWFEYYCLALPRAHGIEARLLSTFFIQDVPKMFAVAAGTVAILAPAMRRHPESETWRATLFAAILGAGLVAAFFLRTHNGGWPNVLLAWTPLACAATAIAASRAEELAKPMKSIVLGGVALQFLAGTFDPTEASPNAADLQ